jgi:hypothetical protein
MIEFFLGSANLNENNQTQNEFFDYHQDEKDLLRHLRPDTSKG